MAHKCRRAQRKAGTKTTTPGPVVIVCGGRSYFDRAVVDQTLDSIGPRKVIHGGAPGADTLAGQWARANETPVCTFPADWAQHGRSAGPIRNQQMLDSGADLVIAFPGGRGTADLVSRAKAAGIPVHVFSGGRFEPPAMPSDPTLLAAMHERISSAITETQHGGGDEWEAVHARVFSRHSLDNRSGHKNTGSGAPGARGPHDSGGPHDD